MASMAKGVASMPWNLDESGMIAVQDGNPVWTYEDGDKAGTSAPVDFGKTMSSIAKITQESVSRKDKLREYDERYSPLAGIDNIADFVTQGRAAMETVANYDDKKILDAGEVQKIKDQANQVWQSKIDNLQTSHMNVLTERENMIAQKSEQINKLIIKGGFDRSTFLNEKTLLPSDVAYSFLGNSFIVEEVDGEIRGYGLDAAGNKLMSGKNPAEYADVEEAIEILVMSHPQKDRILRMDANGSGATETKNGSQSDLLAQYKKAKEGGEHQKMVSLKRKLSEAGYRGIL
jgi:hypothetical protein